MYIRKADISPMYNGEVHASVFKENWYLADVQRRGTDASAYKEDSDISPVNIGEVDASVHVYKED